MQHRRIPSHKLVYLQFLEQMNRPDLDHREVEQIIKQDISLAYRLLKYLNSAAFGLRNRVESIGHAMRMLGEKNLRRWATLIAIAGMSDDKPSELMNVSLARARLCEMLAARSDAIGENLDFFTLGMFSVIDAMVDRPMSEIVVGVNLSEKIKQALLGETNDMSRVLELARAIERCDWNRLDDLASELGLTVPEVQDCFHQAIDWAAETLQISQSLNSTAEAA